MSNPKKQDAGASEGARRATEDARAGPLLVLSVAGGCRGGAAGGMKPGYGLFRGRGDGPVPATRGDVAFPRKPVESL
jgi:hypothetical protein